MSRKLSFQLRTLSLLRSTPKTNPFAAGAATTTTTSISSSSPSPSPAAFRSSVTFFPRHISTVSGYLPPPTSGKDRTDRIEQDGKKSPKNVVKKVEDVMPIATGHEREELEAELQGRDILDINFPAGPFGTKEAPAIVKSYFDRRIVGCPGDEGEDEHDVVWFWLEKGKPHECPVCSQYFELEVVGPGGPPDGHGSDDEGHH